MSQFAACVFAREAASGKLRHDPDAAGRAVVGGTQFRTNAASGVAGGEFAATRLTTAGAVDTSFGGAGTGIAAPDFGGVAGCCNDTNANGIALDPAGRIVPAGSTAKMHPIAGQYLETYRHGTARLNADVFLRTGGPSRTAFDAAAVDSPTGDEGTDWFPFHSVGGPQVGRATDTTAFEGVFDLDAERRSIRPPRAGFGRPGPPPRCSTEMVGLG